MKKRQPNNHDSLTAIRSRNKSNKKPERSIPNNQREGLFGRKGGKKNAVKRGNEDKTEERENLKNKSKARLDLKLGVYPPLNTWPGYQIKRSQRPTPPPPHDTWDL